MVTACAAFLGVTVITYWVTVRGGYVDKPAPAQTGIARIAHRAVGRPDPSGAAPAAPPPSDAPSSAPSAVASAIPSAVPSAVPTSDPTTAPVSANDAPAAGDLDDEPSTSSPSTVKGHASPTAPKTTSKKRRLRHLKRR